MLKITYTDAAPYLEYLTQSVEDWIAHHTVLALRTGQPLVIEPGRASLLLPIGLSDLAQVLLSEVKRSRPIYPAIAKRFPLIEVYRSDDSSIELSLDGLWVAANPETHSGTFLSTHSPWVERNVLNLWQQAQSYALLR